FYDKFFQLVDPEGRLGARSTPLREETLPLSAQARKNAARGARTFETVRRATGEPVRLLTLPITRDGQLVQLLQVGIPLERAERSGDEYRCVLTSSLEDVERLVRLAEDLLLLSRLSVPAQLPRERIELPPLLAEVADVAARVADERGVTCVVKERAPATVMC